MIDIYNLKSPLFTIHFINIGLTNLYIQHLTKFNYENITNKRLRKIKYNKDQYSHGASICALLIAGMFFYWGIDAFLHGFWQFGINWMGFLWIGIGAAIASSQIAALANKSKLRNVVAQEFQINPNVSIEEISAKTGISVRDIRAIILDLKSAGRLRGNFSPTTGEAKSMEVVSPQPELNLPDSTPEPPEKSQFCPNCGTPISRDAAVYCAYCGSKL